MAKFIDVRTMEGMGALVNVDYISSIIDIFCGESKVRMTNRDEFIADGVPEEVLERIKEVRR